MSAPGCPGHRRPGGRAREGRDVATMHRTTMAPTKLELLTQWLPQQAWWRGGDRPELARSGGFRLDDPAGAVGIEFLFVTDGAQATYHVPLSYRGAPLEGADSA